MVNVPVNRPGGVNVTVDKKDTGEIVPNITEQPTLVNAGVAQRGVTGTIGTFEDITLDSLSDKITQAMDPGIFCVATCYKLYCFSTMFFKYLLILITDFNHGFQAISNKCWGKDK